MPNFENRNYLCYYKLFCLNINAEVRENMEMIRYISWIREHPKSILAIFISSIFAFALTETIYRTTVFFPAAEIEFDKYIAAQTKQIGPKIDYYLFTNYEFREICPVDNLSCPEIISMTNRQKTYVNLRLRDTKELQINFFEIAKNCDNCLEKNGLKFVESIRYKNTSKKNKRLNKCTKSQFSKLYLVEFCKTIFNHQDDGVKSVNFELNVDHSYASSLIPIPHAFNLLSIKRHYINYATNRRKISTLNGLVSSVEIEK